MDAEDLVTIGEAARILGRHRATVIVYERSGILPPAFRQPVTNNRMWPRKVIEELAERLEGRVPATTS